MSHDALGGRLLTWRSGLLLALALAGIVAFVLRFVLGLGATTNLSNTYPWGLWIVVDLVWIAFAAGGFVAAAGVHLFGGRRYAAWARGAAWMAFLSYGFVAGTLLADLGRPLHAWQVLVQHPEHSPLYEVTWCITLYVAVLALELAPVLFDRMGMGPRAARLAADHAVGHRAGLDLVHLAHVASGALGGRGVRGLRAPCRGA